jgi:hypothetical protein
MYLLGTVVSESTESIPEVVVSPVVSITTGTPLTPVAPSSPSK